MDPVHLRLAEIGLRVAARYGFALAGGFAVQAHGILDRPSEDIDLFTAWERRDDFAAAVDAVIDGYRDGGYSVEVTQRFDTFARLAVTDPTRPAQPYKVELAANWRALPPVMMDVGPVLHADDVVAGKMSALYTRASIFAGCASASRSGVRNSTPACSAASAGCHPDSGKTANFGTGQPWFKQRRRSTTFLPGRPLPDVDRRFCPYQGLDTRACAPTGRVSFSPWRARIDGLVSRLRSR
ncbi:hypothetical protein Pen02_68070 [Plantactinospora endophytica]|uniref:Nucleotidyl transferase AbiEii/AbiGii toxin family protein n=1 Tax=Plantactinospora endophytica TaxID=673535 RepID=A0ABQ4EAW5_9ACTN|nr:hypothetical protein Pen02_68070 [Plantactinospora endophytica]